MNRQEHLLTIIGEECAEVHQRCSKALRFGVLEIEPNQNHHNIDRVLLEFNDLCAAMEMLFQLPVEKLLDQNKIAAKKLKVETYLNYSKECGTLNNY